MSHAWVFETVRLRLVVPVLVTVICWDDGLTDCEVEKVRAGGLTLKSLPETVPTVTGIVFPLTLVLSLMGFPFESSNRKAVKSKYDEDMPAVDRGETVYPPIVTNEFGLGRSGAKSKVRSRVIGWNTTGAPGATYDCQIWFNAN